MSDAADGEKGEEEGLRVGREPRPMLEAKDRFEGQQRE